jgi:hypothetical protein
LAAAPNLEDVIRKMVDGDSEAPIDSDTALEILSICYRHRFDESDSEFQDELNVVITRWIESGD